MDTVAIVGLGLIGGSFGLALREAGFSGRLLGVSEPRYVEAAIHRGAVSEGASLFEAAAAADLIYLAEPVERILEIIEALRGRVKPGTLITDVGSTKRAIVGQASRCLPHGQFLGGHPMAGKEQRGIQAAESGLFRDRPYILTGPASDSEQLGVFRSWLRRIGADVVEMSAEDHDHAVAFTSHLPQLLSSALALTLSQQQDSKLSLVFGPGLISMTRLALSSPDLWSSVLKTNADEVSFAVQAFTDTLRTMESSSASGSVHASFEQAAEFVRSLREAFTKLL